MTLHEALKEIRGDLEGIPWVLKGSASLYLRGFVDTFNDIDVLVPPECYAAVQKKLVRHSPVLTRGKSGDKLFQYVCHEFPVEIVLSSIVKYQSEIIGGI